MSLLRRRIMMQQAEKSGAKYPLVNGSFAFSTATIEIMNGNHVKISLNKGGYEAYINISDITENTVNTNSPNNINNQSEKFLLKKGDVVEYRLKNIIRTDGGNGIGSCASNTRDTSNRSIGIRIADIVTSDEMSVSKTIDADVSLGCIFIYIYQPKQDEILECDVEFYVNGERYV